TSVVVSFLDPAEPWDPSRPPGASKYWFAQATGSPDHPPSETSVDSIILRNGFLLFRRGCSAVPPVVPLQSGGARLLIAGLAPASFDSDDAASLGLVLAISGRPFRDAQRARRASSFFSWKRTSAEVVAAAFSPSKSGRPVGTQERASSVNATKR